MIALRELLHLYPVLQCRAKPCRNAHCTRCRTENGQHISISLPRVPEVVLGFLDAVMGSGDTPRVEVVDLFRGAAEGSENLGLE